MKIIRPMDGIEDKSSNDAPADGFVQWQTIGRNFLTSISDLVISCNQTTLFAVNESPSFSKTLYAFDLDTGSDVTLPFTLSNFDIRDMAASPDGQYLAIRGWKDGSYTSANRELRVYSLSTGSVLFAINQVASFANICWSPDSGMLAFIASNSSNTTPMVVSPSNWAVVGDIDNIDAMYLETFPSGSFSASWGYGFGGFTAGPDGIYYSLYTFQSYVQGSPPNDFRYHIKKSILGLLTPAGSNTYVTRDSQGPTTNPVVGAYPTPSLLTYNGEKSHILGYLEGDFYAFSETTLAEDTDVPSMPGITQQSISRSLDGQEFVVTNNSVQPYLRQFSSTSYTQTGSLDAATGGFTDNIRYSSDYIVFGAPEGGYGLIDVLTGDRITQVNPSVTNGDIYTYQSRNYEALTDNNDRPDLGAIADPPTWLNMGVVNPLRMFDGKLDSRTTAPDALTITVNPGVIANGLALFNVSAQSVQVTIDDPVDGMVYDSGDIAMLDNSAVSNWWEFFYSPYVAKADLALTDLPPYPDAEITITISNPGDVAAIGEMVLGRIQSIGEIQYGTNVGIIDSSTKERDVFGNFEIIERKFSKRAEFDVSMTTGSVSGVQRILAGYRASPVVWIGATDYEATIIYGFYRDFQINFSHYSLSDATITVEGL